MRKSLFLALRSPLIVVLLLLASVALPSAAAPAAHAANVDPAVYQLLSAAPDGQATFVVLFRERADVSAARDIADWDARGRYVVERLQEAAERSQRDVLVRLESHALPGVVTKHQSFWIANAIVVIGDRRAAEALARFPAVAEIVPELKLDAPEQPDPQRQAAPGESGPEVVPYGISQINADDVWALGYRGAGVVVGGVDTGVQWDHSALKAKYRGWNGSAANHNYNWWDPHNECSTTPGVPCDNNGHGTHTTGTQVGAAGINEIGVAPDAKWIHALGCCPDNATLLSALQWMAAPTDLAGNGADPTRRPQAINNSWGGPGGSKIFYDAIQNLRASGIVPVFSAGNNGDACGTLGSPGDNTNAFNVAATDSADDVAGFSSRGPNPFTGQTGPNVSAPGVNVRSSIPGNTYTNMSGTSMAAPHVTGSIALILSAEPDLKGKVEQIEELLRKTALPLTKTSQVCGGVPGTALPNSVTGWGRIDVLAAVNFVLNSGTLSGTVTEAGTGNPIGGAIVSITRSGKTLTQPTTAAGAYSFITGAGIYEMSVQAYGYGTATASSVSVTKDLATTRDFTLSSLSLGSISGTVLEDGDPAKPVPGALVELAGGIWAPTDANGAYALGSVPFGVHTVRMSAAGYASVSTSVTVDGVETLNFAPAAVPDYTAADGGDTCSVEYGWLDATTGAVLNLDDDANVSVALPWQFTFYGNNYNSLYVSSNGFVSFGAGYSKWHGIVPFEGAPNNQIIALGEDLNPANGTQGKIYTKDLGDGRFVIQYDAVQHWASGNPETFQIILNNNDDTILVQYKTVSWPEFANAGIENSDGSRGILYSYANDLPLYGGLAVKYLPHTGVPPACVPAAPPDIAALKDGLNLSLQWQHEAPNASYRVWGGATPYFAPGDLPLATLPATPGMMTYPAGTVLGNPDVGHYYYVQGYLNGGGSGPSNRVGEFEYTLQPGQ